jgi:pantetheine-phosphate adenylyltransferase
MSLVERGLAVFDQIVVAVARNPAKETLFTLDERLDMLRDSLAPHGPGRVTVDSFEGLTVDYAKSKGASAILRGLRGAADFEYEFELATINRHLDAEMQTVFMMADVKWFFISSTMVKEAASLGADIDGLVPPPAAVKLGAKFPGARR